MLGSKGMPLALQVVGLPNRDETVLGVMQIIESIIDYHSRFAVQLDKTIHFS